MKQEKQIFYKTVRSDGRSVHAPGWLGRKYEIGKTYRFPNRLPAHVFIRPSPAYTDTALYYQRREASMGNRVLICFGILWEKRVPVFLNYIPDLTYTIMGNSHTEILYCSPYFTVIGELFVPRWMIDKEHESCLGIHTMKKPSWYKNIWKKKI